MAHTRRVAIMIDLQWPLKHHQGVFAGVMRYAGERDNWDCEVDLHAGDGMRGDGSPWYDGVVARATRELVTRSKRANVPVVNVWMNSPVRNVTSVFYDVEKAARVAAEHLIARGLRQFGYLGYSNDRLAKLQMAAFRKTVAAAGFPCTTLLVPADCGKTSSIWRKFRSSLAQWIESWPQPIGIYTAHDILARYLASACLRKRIRVPEDAALVGTSNEPIVCLHPQPLLTSVELDFEAIGYNAAKLLDQLMAGAAPPKEPLIVSSIELVARQSTDIVAVNDSMVARAMRFMAEHGDGRIRVNEVAEHVHATPRTLERRFRAALGRTMSAEIMRLRIERVKRQLVETKAPLKVLAIRLGFRDDKRLCEAFRRVEGVTPGEYRRRAQKTPEFV